MEGDDMEANPVTPQGASEVEDEAPTPTPSGTSFTMRSEEEVKAK